LGLGVGAGIGLSDRVNLRDRNNLGQGQRDKMANWQNRLQDELGSRPDSGRWDDARDHWQDHHQDWNDWANHDWHNHGDWHHGYWGGYYGGWAHHLWYQHPIAATFGLTAWGVNAMSYWTGYSPYVNPYYVEPAAGTTVVYDYSQPILDMTPPPADSEATPPPPSAQEQEALKTFDQARESFKAKRYDEALTQVDKALKSMPNDAIIHEFRALTLFCLARYREAAATLYPVLAVTPGMDWTTMSSLFFDLDEYTARLRALEEYARTEPKAPDAHFLLYYLYKTGGYNDAAARQIKKVTELTPDDPLAKQLLSMITPIDTNAAPPNKPEKSGKNYTKEQLAGKWQAKAARGTITMALAKDGTFEWTYKEGSKTDDIRGVFAIDGDTLALQPDSGGTMLAEVDLASQGTLKFIMIGAPEKDPGLNFSRQ